MSQSRVENSMRNSLVGMISYSLTSVITFVSRAIFIRELGVEYLGVSGLYSNILSVLALSDLGIYTVMVFSLYKPVAEGDTQRIASMMKYYQRLYLLIAGVVLLLGLACIPLLPFVVNNSGLSQQELVLYYVLILANSMCSYLAITKSTLIRADQKMRIIQGVQMATSLCMHLVQIAILIWLHNYTVYLCMPIIFTLFNNVILTLIANRKYPYLKTQGAIPVDKEIKKNIASNLKATFLYKMGATIINSTDNILISVLLGTLVVGYYNNYYTVITVVNAVITIFITSISASIGNYNATKSSFEKFKLFRMLLMGFYGVASFAAACYVAIFNDFMRIWIGEAFLLDDGFLLALVFNVTVACVSNPLWMTRESSGVFQSVRYVMLGAAAINVVLSIVLARVCGLSGIILATAIARLLTLFWYEPKMLCQKAFDVPVHLYWRYVLKLFVALLPAACIGWLLHGIETTNVLAMVGKVAACGATVVCSFAFVFRNSEEMVKTIALLRTFGPIRRMTSKTKQE